MPLTMDDPRSIGVYQLIDRLGAGSMGVVYLGRSPSGREVAIKVVHAQYAQDPSFRVRFRQEVAAIRRVSAAFTASVLDADPDADRPWMVTEYVPGPSLAGMLHDSGPLDATALRRLALGLVEALQDIHRAGVVHRDLKPSNVLMAPDGPRVIDFGISRAAWNQQSMTATGHLIGTPPFMSPEQFSDPRSVGPASDVFSLASLLVHAATGRGPFNADSPYVTALQVMYDEPSLDGVTEPLRGMAERCLAKTPDDRPKLPELAELFASLPEAGQQQARRTPREEPPDAQTRTSVRAQPGTSQDWPPPAGRARAVDEARAVVRAVPAPGRGASAPAAPGDGDTVAARRARRLRPVLAGVAGVLAFGLVTYFGGDALTAPAGEKNTARRPAAPSGSKESPTVLSSSSDSPRPHTGESSSPAPGTQPITAYLRADGNVEPDSNPWWDQSSVTVRSTTPLTRLKVVGHITQTGGVVNTGTWTSLGGQVSVVVTADTTQLNYAVTLNPGVTLDPGTYGFEFQYNHSEGHRDAGRDDYKVTSTSSASVTDTCTGGF